MSAGSLIKVPSDDRTIVWITCDSCHDDDRLSWKACGLLWYLLSHSDGWRFYRSDLINRHTDGKLSVDSGLGELKEAGYLRIVPNRTSTGVLDGYDWLVSDLPLEEEEWGEFIRRRLENRENGQGVSPDTRFSGNRGTGKHRKLHKHKLPSLGTEKVDPGNGDLFPTEEETSDFVLEVGSFCERLGLDWKLKRTLAEWCREVQREPSYAGVDFALETRKAAEYWEANGRKKPKSPDRSLRNWFSNAAKFAREERSRRVEEKEEEVGVPDWASAMAEEYDL